MAKLDRLAEEKKRKLMMAKLQQEQLQTDRQSGKASGRREWEEGVGATGGRREGGKEY